MTPCFNQSLNRTPTDERREISLRLDDVFKMLRTDSEHSRKLQLLGKHDLRDALRRIPQLRIRGLHLIANREDHLVHERLLLPQQTPVPNPAAKNLAQHITASLIRRGHTVRDQKRRRPRMVRNNPQRRRTLLVG